MSNPFEISCNPQMASCPPEPSLGEAYPSCGPGQEEAEESLASEASTIQLGEPLILRLDDSGLIANRYWVRAGIEGQQIVARLSDGQSWLETGAFIGSAIILVTFAGPIGIATVLVVGGYGLYTTLDYAVPRYLEQQALLNESEIYAQRGDAWNSNQAFVESLQYTDGIAVMVDFAARLGLTFMAFGVANGARAPALRSPQLSLAELEAQTLPFPGARLLAEQSLVSPNETAGPLTEVLQVQTSSGGGGTTVVPTGGGLLLQAPTATAKTTAAIKPMIAPDAFVGPPSPPEAMRPIESARMAAPQVPAIPLPPIIQRKEEQGRRIKDPRTYEPVFAPGIEKSAAEDPRDFVPIEDPDFVGPAFLPGQREPGEEAFLPGADPDVAWKVSGDKTTPHPMARLNDLGPQIGYPELDDAVEAVLWNESVESLENILEYVATTTPENRHPLREIYSDLERSPARDHLAKLVFTLARRVSPRIRELYATTGAQPLLDVMGTSDAQRLFNAILPEGTFYIPETQTLLVHVWSPLDTLVSLETYGLPGENAMQQHALERDSFGNYTGVVRNVAPGTLYKFRLTKADVPSYTIPDPQSHAQPYGVHEASQVVDPRFDWGAHQFKSRQVKDMIIYQIHVGTFTATGNIKAMLEGAGRAYLEKLRAMGFNTLYLMPIWQFPGEVNVGYDPVFLQAPAAYYGDPATVRAFVKMAHEMGFSVIADHVFNHLGPEGNYYSAMVNRMDRQGTDAGSQLALTAKGSAHERLLGERVRDQNLDLLANTAHDLVRDYGLDGLRLDMVSWMADPSGSNGTDGIKRANARAVRRVYDAARDANPNLIFIIEDPRVEPEKQALFYRIWGDLLKNGHTLDSLGISFISYGMEHTLTQMFGLGDTHYRGVQLNIWDLIHVIFDGLHDIQGIDRRLVAVPTQTIATHDQDMNEGEGRREAERAPNPETLRLALALPFLGRGAVLVFQGNENGNRRRFYFLRDVAEIPAGQSVFVGRDDDAHYNPFRGPFSNLQALRDQVHLWRQQMSLDPQNPAHTDQGIANLTADLAQLRNNSEALRATDPDSSQTIWADPQYGWTILKRRAGSEPDADDVIIGINTSYTNYAEVGKEIAVQIHEPDTWKMVINTADPRYGGNRPLGPVGLDTSYDWNHIPIPPRSVVVFRRVKPN